MSDKRPNFLIVGGAKCGTTSIYNYLKQHPQIFMPEHKEPLFMMSSVYKNLSRKDPRYRISERYTVFSFEAYMDLFRKVKNEIAIGEASTTYLYYHKVSIPNIHKYLGDVRIIIFLRNPVDKAYSSYTHLLRDGAESSSFEKFLENEEERKAENWDFLNFPKSTGFYYDQVKAYLTSFSKVKVCLLDDLKKEPVKTIKDLYEFLGVNQVFEPDVTTSFNKSGKQRFITLNSFLNKENLLKYTIRPLVRTLLTAEQKFKMGSYLREKNQIKMKLKTRSYLKNLFREDILKLQELIERNLSHWL